MKRSVFLLLTVLLLCGCTPKQQPAAQAQTTAPTQVTTAEPEGGVITDQAARDVITVSYPIAQLRQLLGDLEYTYDSNATELPKLSMADLNAQFPIECLKNKYCVFSVQEGGYYYVFWSKGGGFRAGDPVDLSRAKVNYAWYVPRLCDKSEFESLVIGESTLSDVKKIDPSVVTHYGLDSFGGMLGKGHAAYTCCALADGAYLLICFDYVNNEAIVQLIEDLESTFAEGWFKTVVPEDWPA